MNLLGIVKNFITIITEGFYAPIDGPNVDVYSPIYETAFELCSVLGNCSF